MQQAKVYEVRGAEGYSPDAAGQSVRGERRWRVQPSRSRPKSTR